MTAVAIVQNSFTSLAYLILSLIVLRIAFRYKCNEKYNTTIISTVKSDHRNEPLLPLPSLYFIMHNGPLKTATSTIQCELKELYEKDLFYNVDLGYTTSCHTSIVKHNKIHDCFRTWLPNSTTGMPECWENEYIPYIKKQKKHNRSIIMSDEILAELSKKIKDNKDSKQFVTDLQSSLKRYGYQLWVVTTYRYYPEWIYSLYTQKNKMKDKTSKLNRNYSVWPDQGGFEVPTIEKWIYDYKPERFYTGKLIDFWHSSSSFEENDNMTIKVINMDDGDIMKQFLCDGLPSSLSSTGSSTNMCDLVKNVTNFSENKSPNNLWCDTLATKAHENGLIDNNNMSRVKIIKDIEEYASLKNLHYQTSASIPKTCPSQKFYDLLFNESMTHYFNIFKNYDFYYKTLEDKKKEYIERLNNMKDNYKFCTVDAEKMLLQEEWISFFKRHSS